LQEYTGSIAVGVGYGERIIHLEIPNVTQPVGGIVHPSLCRCSLCWPGYDGCGSRARGCDPSTTQELSAANFDDLFAAFHEHPPCLLFWHGLPKARLRAACQRIVTQLCGYHMSRCAEMSRLAKMKDTARFGS